MSTQKRLQDSRCLISFFYFVTFLGPDHQPRKQALSSARPLFPYEVSRDAIVLVKLLFILKGLRARSEVLPKILTEVLQDCRDGTHVLLNDLVRVSHYQGGDLVEVVENGAALKHYAVICSIAPRLELDTNEVAASRDATAL